MQKRAVVRLSIPFATSGHPGPLEGTVVADSATKHRYMEALRAEVEGARELLADYEVAAVSIEGGSPSCMRPDDVAGLGRHLRSALNLTRGFEFSMQLSPRTAGTPCMEGLKGAGVNRVRLMAPSVLDEELAAAGCGFTSDDVNNALAFLGRFGFRNLSVEVCWGLPGQDEKSLVRSLQEVLSCDPEHVRVHCVGDKACTGTEAGAAGAAVPQAANDLLAGKGLAPYAAGRYAKPGYEAAMVSEQLAGCDVFGFGLGATSLMGGMLCTNTADLQTYLACSGSYDRIVVKAEPLTDERLEELAAGLRLPGAGR